MDALIRARSLCLDVPIFLQRERQADNWASMFLGAAFDPPRRAMTRLLDGLDFELRDGDRLAILGRNGAGKSTLLRVLNRVYLPTSGSLEVRGTCQALLNMSLGFSAEATVRENIFLRGIAMGLRAAYLRHQVDPILEFSGLQDKATHRLRTLSSGQKMRLGFAISTSVQNDIILMDEWVGAGDAEFMARATERMRSRVGGSKILVLASHSVGLLRSICNKGIVLERGRLVFSGDIVPALEHYHASMAAQPDPAAPPPGDVDPAGSEVYGAAERIARVADGRFRVTGWIVDNEGGVPGGVVIEVKGRRYVAARVRHHARPDVVRHFGLARPDCGFHAVFNVPGAATVADLGDDVKVFGGTSPELAHAPLRIAPGFTRPETNA